MIASALDVILHLHGWPAIALVFALPALEASAFVGFLFPGEIAVFLGGVLAYQGRISLGAAIAAAVFGAIAGDTVGYFIGRRWGRAMLHGTLGRLPLIRRHLADNVARAEAYLKRRGPRALVVGRFTAGLRVIVPGLAGMAEVPYRTFLPFNVIGGALWGTGFVLLGFFGGAAWRTVEGVASKAGFVLLGLIVLGLVVTRLLREADRFRRWGDRVAALRLMASARRRFRSQLDWLKKRLDPGVPTGFPLSLAVASATFLAWTFGGLTQDVVGIDELGRFDPKVETFVVAHRVEWVTSLMKVVTWAGSTAVVVPLVVAVGAYFYARRYTRRPGVGLAASLSVGLVLYNIAKPLVGRARPPTSLMLVRVAGPSFPSGHAVQAVAVYGTLALFLSEGRQRHVQIAAWSSALLLALVVGASRLYLGVHWLTDVLAGYALGGLVVALTAAALLIISARRKRGEPA